MYDADLDAILYACLADDVLWLKMQKVRVDATSEGLLKAREE